MTQEGKLPMGKKSPKNAVKNCLQLYLAKSEPSSFSSSPQALSLSLFVSGNWSNRSDDRTIWLMSGSGLLQ